MNPSSAPFTHIKGQCVTSSVQASYLPVRKCEFPTSTENEIRPMVSVPDQSELKNFDIFASDERTRRTKTHKAEGCI